MARYPYIIVSVPSGCTEYTVDDIIELHTTEPPEPTKTIGEGPCAGTVVELVS